MILSLINLGNFHPVFVHLPIGILIFVFAIEAYQKVVPNANNTRILKTGIALGVLSAIASIITGLNLEENGAYDAELLFNHKWMAIGLTLISVVLYFAKESNLGWLRKMYFPLFCLVMVMLTLAGHWGGSMTHGEGFLTKEASSKKHTVEDVEKALVYAEIVQPILNDKCVSCHNPKKAEGDLLLTSKKDLLKGGESGSVFDSIDDKTLFLQRIHLPLANEEHMPPKGKVQLTPNEIALLQWWMEHKNCFDCVAGDLDRSNKIQGFLSELEEDTSTRAQLAKQFEPVPVEWLQQVRLNGITIYPLSEDSPLYEVSLAHKDSLNEFHFKVLEDYAEQVVELNLGYTNLNDELAKKLTDFENLTKLQLQNTLITDKTITVLKNLKSIESLNLYGTKITENSLATLKELPNLKDVYLFKTDIKTDALAVFSDDIRATVHTQNDTLFGQTELLPPTILADTYFIKEEVKVTLSYPFDSVEMFYTIDGTEPDTTSIKYVTDVILRDAATFKAITFKKGWGMSDVVAADFLKVGVPFADASLGVEPSGQYVGAGAKTLTDLKRGSTNFVDGNWLGFEGKHTNITISFDAEKEIKNVTIGTLSAPASWIFFPAGFEVLVSNDGANFKTIKKVKLDPEEPNSTITQRVFDVDFPKTSAKYVKVQINSILKNPVWHPNPGGKSWLFVDEVVVN